MNINRRLRRVLSQLCWVHLSYYGRRDVRVGAIISALRPLLATYKCSKYGKIAFL